MKRLESLWLLYISGLPWQRYHPKPDAVSLFPPRLWKLDPGFHVKPHPVLSTWVRTLKPVFSPVFTQNKNSEFSRWEPVGGPSPPVRAAQVQWAPCVNRWQIFIFNLFNCFSQDIYLSSSEERYRIVRKINNIYI
jgi:hypothetical protein